MYKCQLCGNVSQPRTPAYRVILETRDTTYPFRPKVNACWKRMKDGGRKFVHTDDRGGPGRERAREVIACAACAAGHQTRLESVKPERPRRPDGLKRRA